MTEESKVPEIKRKDTGRGGNGGRDITELKRQDTEFYGG
jgi:hypothetical protein